MVTRGWMMGLRRGRRDRSTTGVSKPPGRGKGGRSGECRMAGVRLTIWKVEVLEECRLPETGLSGVKGL